VDGIGVVLGLRSRFFGGILAVLTLRLRRDVVSRYSWCRLRANHKFWRTRLWRSRLGFNRQSVARAVPALALKQCIHSNALSDHMHHRDFTGRESELLVIA